MIRAASLTAQGAVDRAIANADDREGAYLLLEEMARGDEQLRLALFDAWPSGLSEACRQLVRHAEGHVRKELRDRLAGWDARDHEAARLGFVARVEELAKPIEQLIALVVQWRLPKGKGLLQATGAEVREAAHFHRGQERGNAAAASFYESLAERVPVDGVVARYVTEAEILALIGNAQREH